MIEIEPFTKVGKCAICDLPFGPDDNWGCAHAWLPVAGPIEMVVELHSHVHIGCAEGTVKLLALNQLGHSRLGLN